MKKKWLFRRLVILIFNLLLFLSSCSNKNNSSKYIGFWTEVEGAKMLHIVDNGDNILLGYHFASTDKTFVATYNKEEDILYVKIDNWVMLFNN